MLPGRLPRSRVRSIRWPARQLLRGELRGFSSPVLTLNTTRLSASVLTSGLLFVCVNRYVSSRSAAIAARTPQSADRSWMGQLRQREGHLRDAGGQQRAPCGAHGVAIRFLRERILFAEAHEQHPRCANTGDLVQEQRRAALAVHVTRLDDPGQQAFGRRVDFQRSPREGLRLDIPITMQSDLPVRKPFDEPLLQSQPFMLKSIALVLGLNLGLR